MTKKENKNITEDVEFGLDSRYSSNKEKQSEATALMEARLERMKNLSKDQIIRAKLMQLRLKMEDYIQHPVYEKHNYFSEFLKIYIDTLYTKRIHFAHDIDITPIRLSQVINNHREPKDEFLKRLMVHSEKVYENICEFQEETWYQLYFHEKLYSIMARKKEWKPKVAKHVKYSK
ncbi:MAG: hypothetical protein EA359_03900 [Balneolaceae bacterium]|nr:MAG: hypothetical protein EA359_03900 [Balneolaceae bacterium]